MGTSAGTGTPPSAPSSLGAFPGYVGALEKTAAVTTPQYTEAQNTYNQAIAQLRGLQAAQATAQKDIASEANPLSVSEGLSGITGQYYAGQEQAAAQQAAAAQAAAQAATGQQQAQQSGLAAAAQLGQPYAASVLGQYAPLTGEVQPYTSAGGTAGSGIGAGAQMEGNYSLAQNYYSGMVPAYNQAQSILNGDPTTGTQGLNGFLKANPDINPSTLNAANFVNQWTNNQFSSPKYQELGQYLTELLTTLTPIVGAQGVSNYKQQLVQSMVNPTSSTPSLQQQIQNMMNIANGKMNATYQTFTNPTATGIQNAGTQTNGTQPSSTGSSDINSWNFSING